MKERTDKIISANLNITRTEAKSLIKSGSVFVNDNVVRDGAFKLDAETDRLFVGGREVIIKKYVYIMLNKPLGVVSATEDGRDKTVIDILPEEFKRKNLFPAGRLDKNTVGFCLITDDGDFAHRILSPANHVKKTYIACVSVPIDFENAKKAFKDGVVLKDGTVLLSAELKLISDTPVQTFEVTVKEGKYHQVRRMFASLGTEVAFLKRVSIGSLNLDESLDAGESRYITEDELKKITE